MNRRAWIRKIRSKPRRGRIRDKHYLAWIHTQPCIVSGMIHIERSAHVEAHHVRRHGEQKNDYRTVPLLARFHRLTSGGELTVEHGKQRFEQAYGVNIEAEIARLNAKYEAEMLRKILSIDTPEGFAQ